MGAEADRVLQRTKLCKTKPVSRDEFQALTTRVQTLEEALEVLKAPTSDIATERLRIFSPALPSDSGRGKAKDGEEIAARRRDIVNRT